MPRPLIPRRVLFAEPDHANAQLSPDGRFISYLANLNGIRNILVAPIDDLAQANPITHVSDTGLWDYIWAATSDAVLFGLDDKGNERWNVYRADLASGQTVNL